MDRQRSIEILTALSQGVNPLTGEILQDNDICNHAEIVRCFYFVLGELQSKNTITKLTLENAGKPWTEAENKQLSDEYDLGMKISEITEIHKRSRGSIEAHLFRIGKTDKATYFNR